MKYTTEEFIEKAKEVHGNKFNYDFIVLTNLENKIKIDCDKHGLIEIKAGNHLRGAGCRKCSNKNNGIKQRKSIEKFIEESSLKHKDKYDYSKVNYVNNKTQVEIICPSHGSFFQKPNDHLQGKGCLKCYNTIRHTIIVHTYDKFIEKANKIHNNLYDYSNINYVNNRVKININCNIHGMFSQSPNNHLKGAGCPKCKSIISKPEIEVQDFIKSLGFKIQCNNRKILNGKELDIYIPSLKKAIEFNGTYWHYDKTNPNCKPSCYHSTKSKLCKSKNINLLHLREDLWKKDKQKMKKVIHKFLDFKN